jgi:hypothetical protein
MSCLLPGLLCLGWDDEDPMLSLLCLYRKIYHYHIEHPDHLRPRYKTSMVMRFSPASIYKPSLSSTLLRSSHHTFKIFTQKKSPFALCLLSWPSILQSSECWPPILSLSRIPKDREDVATVVCFFFSQNSISQNP